MLAASRSPAATCASPARQRMSAAGYGRWTASHACAAASCAAGSASPLARACSASALRSHASSTGPPSSAAAPVRPRWKSASSSARRRGLVVAEVAGALRRVGLDDDADGGHAGEAHDVVGAGLDAVQRPADGGAGRLEIAGAALELGAQGAHDAEELRLVDVDGGDVDVIEQRSRAGRRRPGRGRARRGARRSSRTWCR